MKTNSLPPFIANFWRQVFSLAMTSALLLSLPGNPCHARFVYAYGFQESVAAAETTAETTVKEAGPSQEDQKSYLYILEYQGIEPTFDSLREYLRSLQPDHPAQKRIATDARELIRKLGSENYHERRKAREALSMMPSLPLADLRAARSSIDPEVRASAAMILEYSKKRAPKDSLDGITRAVCRAIIFDKQMGLAIDLLDSIELFENPQTIRMIQNAVAVSAEAADVDDLLVVIAGLNSYLRLAALGGLVNVQKEECTETLIGLLQDQDDNVRYFASRELADMGVRDSINGLVSLMESDKLEIRLRSNRTLRALTGKKFDYFAFEKPDARAASIKLWKEWLAGEGANATLQFPLVESNVVVGRILVSDYTAGKVVELDMDGNVTWEKEMSNPWAVMGLPNGNRLIGIYGESEIVEYDSEGKEVWRVTGVPGNVMGIDRREGRTLAACSTTQKIVEYNQKKEIVWETEVPSRPTDAKYLDNGNILVVLMNPHQVIEINRDGDTVWELESDDKAMAVQRTGRGTTIIVNSQSHTILEYDMDGNQISKVESTDGNNIVAAREMENGDFVISTSSSVRRQKRDGTVLWQFDNLTYCYNVNPY